VRHADLALLVVPRTLLGSDRQAFLEEALPGLTGSGLGPLRLREAPFLRAVWIDGPADRPWAHPVDLRSGVVDGATADDVTDALLDELESEVTAADLAVTIYTSGTTAEPKGVSHTHGALARKGWTFVDTMTYTRDDRVFCGMPFFWVGGLAQVLLPCLSVGATILCLEKPDPEPALDLMEREQLTRIAGWPGVTGPILGHPSVATRNLPPFSTPKVIRGGRNGGGIGMTETLAGYSSVRPVKEVPVGERGVCMGLMNPGMEARIVDPDSGTGVDDGVSGSIQIRGFCLMAGLHKHEREETFTPDGWYDTGDKGYFKDGLLYFEGRYKEMIKTSGSNVAPPEVEQVLASFPEVAEAHVLGIPDEQRGELVAAAVVPAAGRTIDPDALVDNARKELSNYKVPRKVVVLRPGEVPSLPNGKPDRLAIRRLLTEA
jgi:acyl-CoA synthetase (AMP-forming)/AMP-acid ligase II